MSVKIGLRPEGGVITIVFEKCENNGDLADPLEELQSALLIAYEHALERGISPNTAIAAILELTSAEMQRLAAPRVKA
jgi:hypothetical protein